jgi:peptidoglycan/xylan/chitin deacetylase (PgdA/CDA1 family)
MMSPLGTPVRPVSKSQSVNHQSILTFANYTAGKRQVSERERALKSIILGIAKRLGLFEVASWLTRAQVRILAYHGIWFRNGHYGNHLFMSPEKFRSRMSWLKKSKYQVVPLDRALGDLKTGGTVSYSTVITIDDGWYGTYKYMLPSLENESLPATIYVYTGAVDTQVAMPNILIPALIHLSDRSKLRFTKPGEAAPIELDIASDGEKQIATSAFLHMLNKLTEDQARDFCREIAHGLGFDYDEIVRSRQFGLMTYDEITDASKRGIDIQLHTHSHQLTPESPEKIVNEIRINREKLAAHVDSSLDHFCYPSGVNCPAMHSYLDENGVKSATLIETGLVSPKSHRFELKRILDGEDIDLLEFEAEMSGFLEIFRTVKRALVRA